MSLIQVIRKLCCCITELRGACCYPDGNCINETLQEFCLGTGGIGWHPGTDCTFDLCRNACCLPPNTPCNVTEEWDCDDLGPTPCGVCEGNYFPGFMCAAVECGSVVGACCLPNDGGCIDGVSNDECGEVFGIYQGDGTSCIDEDIVCVDFGACCQLLWNECGIFEYDCTFITETACRDLGGSWQKDLPCNPDPCPTACCCTVGGCAGPGTDSCSDAYRITTRILSASGQQCNRDLPTPAISCIATRNADNCSWECQSCGLREYCTDAGEFFPNAIQSMPVDCDESLPNSGRKESALTCSGMTITRAGPNQEWEINGGQTIMRWPHGNNPGGGNNFCVCAGCFCTFSALVGNDPCNRPNCCPPAGTYAWDTISGTCLNATGAIA